MDNIVGIPITGIVLAAILVISSVYIFAKEMRHPEKNMVDTPGWLYVPSVFGVALLVALAINVIYQNSFDTAIKIILGWGVTVLAFLPFAEARDAKMTRKRLSEMRMIQSVNT